MNTIISWKCRFWFHYVKWSRFLANVDNSVNVRKKKLVHFKKFTTKNNKSQVQQIVCVTTHKSTQLILKKQERATVVSPTVTDGAQTESTWVDLWVVTQTICCTWLLLFLVVNFLKCTNFFFWHLQRCDWTILVNICHNFGHFVTFANYFMW